MSLPILSPLAGRFVRPLDANTILVHGKDQPIGDVFLQAEFFHALRCRFPKGENHLCHLDRRHALRGQHAGRDGALHRRSADGAGALSQPEPGVAAGIAPDERPPLRSDFAIWKRSGGAVWRSAAYAIGFTFPPRIISCSPAAGRAPGESPPISAGNTTCCSMPRGCRFVPLRPLPVFGTPKPIGAPPSCCPEAEPISGSSPAPATATSAGRWIASWRSHEAVSGMGMRRCCCWARRKPTGWT